MKSNIEIDVERCYGMVLLFSIGDFSIKTDSFSKYLIGATLGKEINKRKAAYSGAPWIFRNRYDLDVKIIEITKHKKALMIQPGCCKFHLLEKKEDGIVYGKKLDLKIYSSDFISASMTDGALVVEFNEYRHGDQCSTIRAEIVREKRSYDLITWKVLATERKLMQKMIVEIGGKQSEVTRDEFK